MGTIIKTNMINTDTETFRLLIYCNAPPDVIEQSISINKMLAEKLLQIKSSRRTMKIEECFYNTISELPENSTVSGIDVMFNPKYKIDILRILIETNKRRPFRLVWPGTFDNNKLKYGEEDLADYKTYEISDYDIMCVV